MAGLLFNQSFCAKMSFMAEKTINKKVVENLAELSRLDLTDNEKEKLVKDLNSILDYVKELEQVPTQGINLDFVKKNEKKLRSDIINNDILASNDELIASFKEQKEKRLKIPPIFN